MASRYHNREIALSEISAPGSGEHRVADLDVHEPADHHAHHHVERKKVGPKLTAFLLLNAMIGAGILNVPYTFKQSGVVLGCVIFLFFGFLTWFSLVALIQTGIVTKTDDYGKLAFKACGKKGEVCVDFWTVLEGVGGCLGYLVIIGVNMSSVCQFWFETGPEVWYTSYYFLTALFLAVFIAPLTFIRQFGHFAWISVRVTALPLRLPCAFFWSLPGAQTF